MKYQIPDGAVADYIKLRISGVADAANRARWTLAAISAVCAIQLIAVWNYTLSWMVFFAKDQGKAALPPKLICGETNGVSVCTPALSSGNRIERLLQENLLTEWVKNLTFDMPIIGASASVADSGIIGGILLLILSTWMMYALRRENHLIHDLFVETESKLRDSRTYVFFGVVNTQLFATVGTDEARSDFQGQSVEASNAAARAEVAKRKVDRAAYRQGFWKRLSSKADAKTPRYILARAVVMGIFFAPILTLLLVGIADTYSLNNESNFRPNGIPLHRIVSFAAYFPRMLVSCVLLWWVTRTIIRAFDYQAATVTMLQDAFDNGWDILRQARRTTTLLA
jgi:hypothetical protein